MTLLDLLLFSIASLKRNKMRTLLTVAGVVIGIAAIVFLVSLGFGLQELVIQKIASMKELTQIQVDPRPPAAKLTKKNIVKLGRTEGVKWVSPSYYLSAQMLLGDEQIDVTLYALNPKYMEAEDVKADVGTNLTSPDAKEIIVSRNALKVFDLLEAKSLVGREATLRIYLRDKSGNFSLKINDPNQIQKFKIVGIAKNVKESSVYIPIKSLDALKIKTFDKVMLKTTSREVVKDVKKQVSDMGFKASSIRDTISEIQRYFRAAQIVLGILGMIALLVASIGIFNTMTISLLERTHEIGIMKAIGATNKDVRRMFLFEAAQIGFWGGFWGLAVGWLMGLGINFLANSLASKFQGKAEIIFQTPVWFSAIAIFFALMVSLFAGIYPARRAGKLGPLEAIRYE